MSEHTPGPWQVKAENYPIADTGDYDGCWKVFSENPKRSIVEIWEDSDTAEANARLIAAAPDLLEALKAFVNHGSCFDDDDMEKARAAIAKAIGEQE